MNDIIEQIQIRPFQRQSFLPNSQYGSDLPPEEIIAELPHAVLAFTGGTKQKDDLTAVLIKRTAT